MSNTELSKLWLVCRLEATNDLIIRLGKHICKTDELESLIGSEACFPSLSVEILHDDDRHISLILGAFVSEELAVEKKGEIEKEDSLAEEASKNLHDCSLSSIDHGSHVDRTNFGSFDSSDYGSVISTLQDEVHALKQAHAQTSKELEDLKAWILHEMAKFNNPDALRNAIEDGNTLLGGKWNVRIEHLEAAARDSSNKDIRNLFDRVFGKNYLKQFESIKDYPEELKEAAEKLLEEYGSCKAVMVTGMKGTDTTLYVERGRFLINKRHYNWNDHKKKKAEEELASGGEVTNVPKKSKPNVTKTKKRKISESAKNSGTETD